MTVDLSRNQIRSRLQRPWFGAATVVRHSESGREPIPELVFADIPSLPLTLSSQAAPLLCLPSLSRDLPPGSGPARNGRTPLKVASPEKDFHHEEKKSTKRRMHGSSGFSNEARRWSFASTVLNSVPCRPPVDLSIFDP